MATATATRQEQIERFIVLDAMRVFVQNLCGSCGTEQAGILRQVISPLFGQLWPEGNVENVDTNPEYLAASVRVDLLVSRIFGAVAANAETCRDISGYFQELADKQLHEVEQEARGNRVDHMSVTTDVKKE